MPTYSFIHKKTGLYWEEYMSMAEHDAWSASEASRAWEQQLSPTPTVDSMRMGRQKPPEQFREMLRSMKRANRGSTIEVD